jgi:hypothetical protein
MLRSLLIWCAIIPIAIANGAVRDLLIAPRTGDAPAHVVSTVLLCGAILLWTWLTIGWVRPVDTRAAVRIGLVWLAVTVAFEFLAGHFVFRTPWHRLLADYNLAAGRIWVLVPATTAIAPVAAWWGKWLNKAA